MRSGLSLALMVLSLSVLFAHSAAHAAPRPNSVPADPRHALLDCNISSGNLQQIVVSFQSGAYYVDALNMNGEWKRRPLTADEWNRHYVMVRGPEHSTTLLYQKSGRWYFRYNADGVAGEGDADCAR